MKDHFTAPIANQCHCPHCQRDAYHPDQDLHQQMNLFISRLDEQQRRWYAALESKRIGHGGDRLVSQITGISEKTIRRGRRELATALSGRPINRVRRRRKGDSPDPNKNTTLRQKLAN